MQRAGFFYTHSMTSTALIESLSVDKNCTRSWSLFRLIVMMLCTIFLLQPMIAWKLITNIINTQSRVCHNRNTRHQHMPHLHTTRAPTHYTRTYTLHAHLHTRNTCGTQHTRYTGVHSARYTGVLRLLTHNDMWSSLCVAHTRCNGVPCLRHLSLFTLLYLYNETCTGNNYIGCPWTITSV